MRLYWTLWLIIAFPITFLIPEWIALARGRPQDTLSWFLWHLEKLRAGQPIVQWSAAHFLITGFLIVFATWFVGHIALHIWT